jgi:hypothetical protein
MRQIQPFLGQIDMNENGYIITHDGSKTNIPGPENRLARCDL